MKGKLKMYLGVLVVGVSLILLSGCSSGGNSDDDGGIFATPATVSGAAEEIALSTSQVIVQTDNSDSATITASVLDGNNAIVENATVSFSASGGQISDSSVDTDENGQAQTVFSCGTVDKTNQVVTITAQVIGLDPVTIPIQVTGTTMTLSTGNTNITVGGASETLTILVQAGADLVYNASVTLSVAPAGVITLSQETGNTDVVGELEVDITGVGIGNVTVTVQALGVTATQTYTVGAVGAVFGITSPAADPYSLSTNTDLTITVESPDNHDVRFATTFGAWDGGALLVVEKDGSTGSASAVLNSGQAGIASVQVFDVDDPSITDSLTVAVSAPPSEAAQIALSASATVVAPSTGGTSNSVTLNATVRNATGEVVGGSPVAFSIEDLTGGGEYIYPVIVYTNDYGVATSTFTAGSLSSDAGGVTVKATVVGTAVTNSINIVIGGTAGSIAIGVSTTISSNDTNTSYILPMSVLVADSNGNPVLTTVSLSVWPIQYSTGLSDLIIIGTFDNEDINRSLTLDGGEDLNGDGELTPPNSAAGTLPATVDTDENGVANFNLTYLKSSAVWIKAEIKASTVVYGTEAISTITFRLPYAEGDIDNLSASPYGP